MKDFEKAIKKFLLVFFVVCFSVSVFSISAPVVSSSTHPDSSKWYYSPQANVSWQKDSSATYYAYAYNSVPDTIPDASRTTTEGELALPAKEDGIYYFHIRAVASSGTSDTTHFKIQIDTVGPSRPIVTATTTADNAIKLEWAASEDLRSGVKGYEIYRNRLTNFSITDIGVKKLGLVTETSFLDANDLDEGRTFFYKVVPIDNAGNTGFISAQVQSTIKSVCTLGISIEPILSQSKDALLIKITAQGQIYYSSLKVKVNDSNSVYLFRDKSDYNYWDGNLPLSETDQGNILLELAAKEFYGDNCDTNKTFVFDSISPNIEFVFPKNYHEEISGTAKIKIKAEDTGNFKSGIGTVAVSYDNNSGWIAIGNAIDSNSSGNYSIDWNTEAIPNGYYSLKAVATDKAQNKTEKTKEIFVFNTASLSSDANFFINSVESQLSSLESKASLMEKYGVSSDAFSAALSSGLQKLESARLSLKERQFEEAKASAKSAGEFFSTAGNAVDLNVIASSQFIFNKQQVQILLEAAKMPPETITNAVFLIKQADVSRNLDIVKVKDGNSVFFKAAISIAFNFSKNFLRDNNMASVRVVEIIPKELAESASNIASAQSFEVLEQDPKISFLLDANFFAPKATLVYSLKTSFLDEATAMKLVSAGVVNKFIAPPVLLSPAYGTGGIQIGELAWLAIIAVIVIAIALIIVFVLLKRKGGKGFRLKKAFKKKWYK
ncbi:MAG: Ig-like domain-containing protein [Candidatus ainarchaeum sp.]|nr:Ig-like domain-containing protein [Candidatus ainarchaeum sp.]